MNLNFSEEEILFQKEVQMFLEKELSEDLIYIQEHFLSFLEKDIAL